jgi:Cd2+/Zn2+-exporting ATPase
LFAVNREYLKYVALLSVAFGLPSIAIKAFHTLQRFQCDTNVLMSIATLGALALQDFTEAGAVVFLFSISEWLEVRATSRARTALYEIIHLRPDKANLIHPFTKKVMLVPASAVPVGALVSVRTGDKIPCDGVVVEGNSTVDESSLTGESRPVRKGPNDVVSGGTINVGNTQLVVCTTSTAENSAVARLIRLVEEAQANRSPTEKLVDEFAKRYTPIVILAAILMCSIPWAFGHEIGREWTKNGLVLIVIACPCALIISTPVTYVAGLAATAQRGILIKGGAHLEVSLARNGWIGLSYVQLTNVCP